MLFSGWVNCVYTCIQTSYKCLSHIQNKGCNSKLYMIPGGAISYRCVLRISVVAGSLELDGTTILKG
ncbi:hypothetical protein LOK49_LG08G00295 [Camellia lanceoleosa]|uniref:Uncharacterized protein n=1 Tax=Camellia lanceoleosa TaxID=1840588 RepID=A0ACC0GXD4_9ERIC|nr:hypothetical protein LOK49_LG08G00295 [Camellia lanceoleosa]